MENLDNNATSIILATIGLAGIFTTAVFSYLSLRYSSHALRSSESNSHEIRAVHTAVNGMTQARVDSETRVGEANTELARIEGRDTERTRRDKEIRDDGKTSKKLP